MIKILSPEVINDQNLASGGEKRTYYFETLQKEAVPKKMHQGPRDSKAAPDSTVLLFLRELLLFQPLHEPKCA
jgi:hypothetical protein